MDSLTLQYHFEGLGHEVLYRSTPEGPEVLAVGLERNPGRPGSDALGGTTRPPHLAPLMRVFKSLCFTAPCGRPATSCCERAGWDLLLQDASGRWRPETFLVDSGSGSTTMPAAYTPGGSACPCRCNPLRGPSTRRQGFHPPRLPAASRSWAWTRPNTSFRASSSATRPPRRAPANCKCAAGAFGAVGRGGQAPHRLRRDALASRAAWVAHGREAVAER